MRWCGRLDRRWEDPVLGRETSVNLGITPYSSSSLDPKKRNGPGYSIVCCPAIRQEPQDRLTGGPTLQVIEAEPY